MLWTEQTEKDLAERAEAGSQGQGAMVETQNRLRFAIEVLQLEVRTLSHRMAWVTWALFGFTVVICALIAVLVLRG
jgi:hypothetical protein